MKARELFLLPARHPLLEWPAATFLSHCQGLLPSNCPLLLLLLSHSVMSDSVRPHRQQPTRLRHPWDSSGKNTGEGCHFLLQSMKVKSQSEIAQSCPTLSNPIDCSLPGSSIHGIFQARVLEWSAITFSAISVLSSAYLRLLIFLLAILIPTCASSSPVFL